MTKLYRVLGKRGRITIPNEIRQRVGFSYNDVLSFTEAPDGRTVTVKREKICDNCVKTDEKDTEMTLEDGQRCCRSGGEQENIRQALYTGYQA